MTPKEDWREQSRTDCRGGWKANPKSQHPPGFESELRISSKLVIGGLRTRVSKVSILATGEPVDFEQTGTHLLHKRLPEEHPDEIAGRPEQSIPSVSTTGRFGIWDRSQDYQAPHDFL